MPAYVAPPQASRSGLITTIVVFVVLTVLMSVLFFVRDSDLRKTQIEYEAFQKKYADAVPSAALSTEEYNNARNAAKEFATRSRQSYSVYDLLTQQTKDLATAITGRAISATEAADQAKATTELNNQNLAKYGGIADQKVAPGSSLVDTSGKWTPIAEKLIRDRDDARAQVESMKKEKEASDAAHAAALADKDKQIADAKAETAKGQEQIGTQQKTHGDDLQTVKTTSDQSIANLTQQMTNAQTQVAALTTNVAVITKDRDNLLRVLKRFKANNDPKEDIIRVPDGVITTVSGKDDCFINLGEGDQISKGMTFEVYDPNKGIPALGNGTAMPDRPTRSTSAAGANPVGLAAANRRSDKFEFEMPKGKGSIEVVGVGPGHQAACKIVHQEEGQQITPGDLIANLVYDRNHKFKFIVFGDFDLTESTNVNSRANDIAVIQRLIQQWGGAVQPIADPTKPADSVNADTDFVVVGREPVIPNYSADELQDPGTQANLERAKAKMALYQAVLGKAADLGIPVMNQNRFLYYTGYFETSKR